ncbi:MAG: acylphosphatase [Candidatus Paceibacterota bacterium]|jgi:acylphosphatase
MSVQELKEIECYVHGAIIGVGFRNFAKVKADELHIYGFAENTPEGTVKVVGQGNEAVLRRFIEILSVGPETAEVESIDINWNKVISTHYSVFEVR